jgi:long-subunit acyl-CoA synthetase (AMP-forming)
LVFVGPALLDVLRKALDLPDAPKIADDRIILLCRKGDKPKGASHKCIEELRGEPYKTKPRDETATAYLCYSSGTTGRAKGVETSHHNITSQIQALNKVYEPLQAKKDVVLGILPFSHIYGEFEHGYRLRQA